MRPIKYLFICIFIFIVGYSHGQIDRSTPPPAAAAKPFNLGKYHSFTLKNGLQIFVVENHKLPQIQFGIELKTEAILEGDKAGYVRLADQLMRAGTQHRDKSQLDEEVDFIGGYVHTMSGIYAGSLTKHTDKLLELMTDVLYYPSFPKEELDKLKTQKLSSLAASKENPASILQNVWGVVAYGKDHPYGELVTEETVRSITIDDCKEYYKTYYKPGNAYLVIIGDVTLKQAKKLSKKYFAKWKDQEVVNATFSEPVRPEETYVALVDRSSSVQSEIQVGHPIPLKPGSPDITKAVLVDQILGGGGVSSRLNQNLREDKAFTYGASSHLSGDPIIGSFYVSVSVRNEVTDSAIHELFNELHRIREKEVTDWELETAKASLIGAFGRSLEQPQTLARFAINTAKYDLPHDYYSSYPTRISAVTKMEILETAKKYIHPRQSHIVVVGKGPEIAAKLESFGDLKYFNPKGEEYEPSASTLPEGMTAEVVIDKYISAIGGKEKVKEVKSIKSSYSGAVMETKIVRTDHRKGLKSYIKVEGNGMILQESISNGQRVAIKLMGSESSLGDDLMELQIFDASLFKEICYKWLRAEVALVGQENIDGENAFVVEYTLPLGEKVTEYYSEETGLKLQTRYTIEGPDGDIQFKQMYSDYEEVDGVKFPMTITQSQGPITIKLQVIDFQVNVDFDDEIFVVE